jgi:hypothetical protein
MKLSEFITIKRGELQKLEVAANGQTHDLGPGNLVELLAALINAIDKDQSIVDSLGETNESTQVARALALRAEQISTVKGFIVRALDAAANVEVEI